MQVWVYRNLVQPYANFVQLREKIEDPQYAGWFVHFDNGTNDERITPRCEPNPRLNKTLCTDLFHTKLAWTENGHDCGDHIPCGDYVFVSAAARPPPNATPSHANDSPISRSDHS